MAGYIIDNSAWARITIPAVKKTIESLTDVIYTVTPQRLEFLYSATTPADLAMRQEFLDAVGVYLEPEDRFNEVCEDIQAALAVHGKLRSVGVIDVMIAAHALMNRLTVVHYDSDYPDHIATAVPELQHQWVAPRGTI